MKNDWTPDNECLKQIMINEHEMYLQIASKCANESINMLSTTKWTAHQHAKFGCDIAEEILTRYKNFYK